jgi:hypothetical protein
LQQQRAAAAERERQERIKQAREEAKRQTEARRLQEEARRMREKEREREAERERQREREREAQAARVAAKATPVAVAGTGAGLGGALHNDGTHNGMAAVKSKGVHAAVAHAVPNVRSPAQQQGPMTSANRVALAAQQAQQANNRLLVDMGFTDMQENGQVLAKFDNDISQACDMCTRVL